MFKPFAWPIGPKTENIKNEKRRNVFWIRNVFGCNVFGVGTVFILSQINYYPLHFLKS